ncbi:hypothetical protein IFM89_036873 [Coptis chinensis]|uniref:HMG box domain-containing protein n=1 Tax=Coptis chinensis TaxID=261450 RepID=A0A835M1Q3_9MAGN|nr:hypothetical protein IFM89_036873 [Coptis chinensis]
MTDGCYESTFAMIQNLMECTMKLALFTETSTIKFWYRKNVKVIREAYGLGSDSEKPDGKAAKDSNTTREPASGVKWKSMSDAEKAVYVAKADKKKIEYNNSNTCRLTTRNWLKKTMLKMKRTV